MYFHTHAGHHAHCKGPRGSQTTRGPTRDHHVCSGCIDITWAHERPPRLPGLYRYYTGPRETTTSTRAIQMLHGPTRDHHVYSGYTDITWAHERPPRPLGLHRYYMGPRETTTSTRATIHRGPRETDRSSRATNHRTRSVYIYTPRYIDQRKGGGAQRIQRGESNLQPTHTIPHAPEIAGSTDRPQQSEHHPHTNEQGD